MGMGPVTRSLILLRSALSDVSGRLLEAGRLGETRERIGCPVSR